MNIKTLQVAVLILPVLATANGCTTAVIAGAAAAGGYIAHEKGYRIRNPITKSGEQKDTQKETKE